MDMDLTARQKEAQEGFRAFMEAEIAPQADRNDREERTPRETIDKMARRGLLGSVVPEEYGGAGMDPLTHGLLCEETGRASASLLSLVTAHGMVCLALLKWGSEAQRKDVLPRLARGESLGAFALSEPAIGSDARNVQTAATLSNGSYVIDGSKKWISFGQLADVFLVMARLEEQPTVFLVERERPGIAVKPVKGLLGFRAAMLAELEFDGCAVPAENLVGRAGFGFSHVVASALDHGRFSIAFGCTGLSQACLDACLDYTRRRHQFGKPLKDHQLVQRMIADMVARLKAARLLCHRAARLKAAGDPSSIMETSVAKYYASTAALQTATDAVQIHGANGCGEQYPVQRYFRDAKIMEIIEGSSQIQQMIIARAAYDRMI